MSAAAARIEQAMAAGATVVAQIEQQVREVATAVTAEAEKDGETTGRARSGWPALETRDRFLSGLADVDESSAAADWRS